MIQEERVSKLVTEILELKDWNNWSAMPGTTRGKGGKEEEKEGRRKGGGRRRRTCHINCCGDTVFMIHTTKCIIAILVNISHHSARLTTRNLTWSGTCGASGVGWRVEGWGGREGELGYLTNYIVRGPPTAD